MFQDRIRYELRIMGIWMILIPPLIILTFVLLGLMLTIMQVDHLRISSINREFRDGTSTISGFINGIHR